MDFKFYLSHLDKFNRILDKPDIPEPNKKAVKGLNKIISKLVTRIKRFFALIIDRHWYNETRARKVVEYFIKEVEAPTEAQTNKILAIFDHLAHISWGKNRNYAEQINREDILKKLKRYTSMEGVDEDEDELEELDDDFDVEALADEDGVSDEIEEEDLDESPDPDVELDNILNSFVKIEDPTKAEASTRIRTLFHIHANQFGADSPQEGGQKLSMLECLRDYFSTLSDSKGNAKFATIVKQMEEAIDLEKSKDFVGAAQQKIRTAFANKQPLLIPGGWAGAPSGHAMYYEVRPTSAAVGTFRLYNLGGGVGKHDERPTSRKMKKTPYFDLTGISLEKLTNPHFLKAIKEITKHITLPDNPSQKTAYNSADIYQALKELLEAEEIEPSHSPSFTMSTQQSGICALRSLLAFVAT